MDRKCRVKEVVTAFLSRLEPLFGRVLKILRRRRHSFVRSATISWEQHEEQRRRRVQVCLSTTSG